MQQVLQAAPAILQDLAAHVAEAVAVCYLAEARSGPIGKTFTLLSLDLHTWTRRLRTCVYSKCDASFHQQDMQKLNVTSFWL